MKTTTHPPTPAPALLERPANPGLYATVTTALRLQQRTSRSFAVENVDYLCAWLIEQYEFRIIPKSAHQKEYGRLRGGRRDEMLAVLYWEGPSDPRGFVVCQGNGWAHLVNLLLPICEEAPEQACLFDLISEGGAL